MNRPAAKLSAPPHKFGDVFYVLKPIIVLLPYFTPSGSGKVYRCRLESCHRFAVDLLWEERKLITKFCYKESAELGLVEKKTRPIEKVSELQRFLGVTSLRNINALKRYQTVFRCAPQKRSPEALAAWLRIGEVKGQKTSCARFDVNKLRNALGALRALTILSPDQFEPELHNTLAGAGVVLVLAPHLSKT